MDIYERALRKLVDEKRSMYELARRSGIPKETLRDIRSGYVANPRYDTLKRLARFFCKTA